MLRKVAWFVALLSTIPVLLLLSSSFMDDMARRPSLLRWTCSLGLQSSCVNIARRTWYGDKYAGIDQNLTLAKAMLEQACDKGSMEGCRELAIVYSAYPQNVPPPDDAAWGGKGFKGSVLPSAYTEAQKRNMDYALSIKDDAKARQLFQRSCEGGDAQACWWLNSSTRLIKNEPPLLAWVWMATLLLTFGMALAVMLKRDYDIDDSVRHTKRWVLIASAFVLVLTITGIAELAIADRVFALKLDNILGLTLLLLALLIASGTFAVVRKQDRLAQWLLAIAGFLALPMGLMLVLISREIAAVASSKETAELAVV